MYNLKPKLSTVVIAYNQEEYIQEALQSIVSQKTDFQCEVIVADDASTDKTQDIIRKFAAQYPTLIKPILRKRNIGAWNNFVDALRKANGEYIALCEADDFWVDNQKIQKQVEFLERNKKYALCFHPVRVTFEDSSRKEYVYPKLVKKSDFTLEELLNQNYIQTNSVVYRRQDYRKLAKDVMPGDWYLHLYHAQFGKIGFINKTMSVYRRHKGGIWKGAIEKKEDFWLKYGTAHIKTYKEILKMYGNDPKHVQIIYGALARVLDLFIELDKKNRPQVLRNAVEQFSDIIIDCLISQRQTQQDTITIINHDNEHLHKMLELKENHVKNLEKQLRIIHDSRLWKLTQTISKYKNRF